MSFVSLAFLICLLFLASLYGSIEFSDLIPGGSDILVLFGAFLIVFLAASLVIFRDGWRYELGFEIKALQGLQKFFIYLLAVIVTPFFEETFFRRYLLEIFQHKYSLFSSVLTT